MNTFGVQDSDLSYIIHLLENTLQVDEAILFGSRAMGNFKTGSDVDIAIGGKKIDFNIVAHIHYLLEEESPMPYLFDIVNITHSKHDGLKKHVEQHGKIIFNRAL